MRINLHPFKVFLAVISVTALVFLAASLFSYYRVDKKYAMLLAFFLFVAFAFTTVGIYSGFKLKTNNIKFKRLNLVGLLGNLVIFLFTLGLMLYAALSKATN
jgi:hypothetical protein